MSAQLNEFELFFSNSMNSEFIEFGVGVWSWSWSWSLMSSLSWMSWMSLKVEFEKDLENFCIFL